MYEFIQTLKVLIFTIISLVHFLKCFQNAKFSEVQTFFKVEADKRRASVIFTFPVLITKCGRLKIVSSEN
jgi:hypothetical protein